MEQVAEISQEDIANFILDFDVSEDQLAELAEFIDSGDLEEFGEFTHKPTDIKDFIENSQFLNAKDILYPAVMEEMVELNSGNYVESVLTGAIGTGKTTIALYTTAYQVYLISCMKNPHEVFGLDPASEILFIFQSITEKLAKSVDYMRFKTMIQASPYFKQHFPYDDTIESEMRFPNRIIVRPISGSDTAAIGQNVIGGVIDELNFMSVIDKSKNSIDGGTYDQAVSLYNAIARRRKSRFMKQGKLPGILCLVSSKRYPGQFTDQKEDEARLEIEKTGKTTIFVYDKRLWDIAPDKFIGEWFSIFAGDEIHKPRVLDEDEEVSASQRHMVIRIPEEYRNDFTVDIMNALRDIAGVSTLAMHPFMLNVEAVSGCFRKSIRPIISRNDVDFTTTNLKIYPRRFLYKDQPRWCHIDLAVTGDSAGVVVGTVPEFIEVERGNDEVEILPRIHIDIALEVMPPRGGEILFHKIRTVLYKLRELGLNIKWVTFDSYQSTDSMQILRQKGFTTGYRSMDVDTKPYDILKTALYDDRVDMPPNPKLQKELISLEFDVKKGKVDHPPTGSKDIADSLAGVVYGLTMRREIWMNHSIPPTSIPTSITAKEPAKDNMKKGE